MTYTPINWQTGDTITAEKMNKMDNGWGVGATQLFSETVTTAANPFGDIQANLTYSTEITADTISVNFDGVVYSSIPVVVANSRRYYGGVTSSGSADFSEYPFYIVSIGSMNRNTLFTSTAGEHSVTVFLQSIETSENFDNAVKSVKADSFEIVLGTTTFKEAYEAFLSGKRVYGMEVNPPDAHQYQVFYMNTNDYEAYVLDVNTNEAFVSILAASSEDDVLDFT